MQHVLKDIASSNLDSAVSRLRKLFADDPLGTLRVLREKEVLLRPADTRVRQHLREIVLELLTDPGLTDDALPTILPYLAYCDLTATARDQIAVEAQQHARILARLPIEQYSELCAVSVTSLLKRYAKHVNASYGLGPEGNSRSADAIPLSLINAIWQASGLYNLLPLMLLEIASIAHRGQPGSPPPSRREALVATIRLRRTAAAWQRLSEIRQRIAWGRDVVARVDRNYIVELQPKDAHLECRHLVKNRRHALLGLPPQPLEYMRWALEPPIKRLLHSVGTRFPVLGTTDILETILKDLARQMLPSDIVLWNLALRRCEEGDTARCLLCAYFLRYIISYITPPDFNIRWQHLQRWPLAEVVDMLASSSGVSSQKVVEILPWITWAPLNKSWRSTPLDLERTPYVDLGNATLGMIVVPGVRLNPYSETRRILASMNRFSSAVGESYELYIRGLFADAGFDVVGHSVKVTEGGQLVTDIDILAYKDGVVVVVQAKHIVEPDSHHAAWKAAKEIAKGVRQCIVARKALRNEPSQIFKWFPEVYGKGPVELFCLVVSSSIAFGSELYWPVAVVDDAYLQHVVHIGAARTYNLDSGEVIEAKKLYDGDYPSGPAFRDLMMSPEFLRYYRGNKETLEATVYRIGSLEFRRLDAEDFPPESKIGSSEV